MRAIAILLLLAAVQAKDFSKAKSGKFMKGLEKFQKRALAGTPSFKPTRLPSATPSFFPTEAPTVANGWVVQNYYGNNDCSAAATKVEAHRTGVCIASDSGAPFVMFTCFGETAMAQGYSDSDCSTVSGSSSEFELTCTTTDDAFASQSVSCRSGTDYPLTEFASYSILTSYQQSNCSSDDIVQILAFQDLTCLTSDNGQSMSTVWPQVQTFPTNDCTSEWGTTILSDACSADFADGPLAYYYQDDDVVSVASQKWSGVAAIDSDFHFQVSQTFGGIVPTIYKENLAANNLVVQHTVADIVGSGVTYEDVEVTDLGMKATLRRSLSEEWSTASTVVNYRINYDALAGGYYSQSEAQTALSDALTNSINDGSFLTTLATWNSNVANDETPGLGTVDSTYIAGIYQGSKDTNTDDQGHWIRKQSSRIIAGVVVGIGGCLILTGLFFVYQRMYSNKE